MKTWKKVLIGTVSVATLGAGVNVAAMAAGTDSPRDRIERKVAVTKQDVRGADDHGIREAEARGRQAEGEKELGDDRGQREDEARENEAPQNEQENEANDGAMHEDRSGPSANSGPGSTHDHGRDDHGSDR